MAGNLVFVMLGKRDFRSGGYIFNFRMAEYLESLGHNVDVIHFRTVPPGLPGNWYRASRYICRRILELDPDLVIVSKSYQYMPLFRVSPLSGRVPVLYLMHHLEWMDRANRMKAFMYRTYVRWLLGMADTVWVNSASTERALRESRIPASRVRVISPGFEKTPAPPPDRSGRTGPVRLLCVGSVSPRKAQHVLVRACGLLEEESFILEIAGSVTADEDYASEVERLVSSLGLEERVTMSGNLDERELEDAYRRADILVHPASWEAFGMSILEGMWQGLPVVAANVAAIPELVRDGENGVLVEPGSAEALANGVRYLMENRARRLEMGGISRELAADMNDWNDTGREFAELVNKLLKGCTR